VSSGFVSGKGDVTLYTANSFLRWADWGARLDLDAKVSVTPWLAVGLGGKVGLADRSVSLSATDSNTGTTCLKGCFVSSIESTASTTPFLANAEATLIARPWSNTAIKGFVGLNYDSRVPGISAPTFIATAPFTTPAGIKFQNETSYYGGRCGGKGRALRAVRLSPRLPQKKALNAVQQKGPSGSIQVPGRR
jgi:hypothetical protein